ncbi:glycosyltransferase family 39 protein [Priestia megaterium]|uniref:glycosyltransferase family 39 protein n=1 Tax=Priestia megaterium TaxID=1404 RepID=UPI0011269F6B|nr:glycosyltransferase family 39 protein [Priestia megaterium]TPF18710.1 4-amino-4-deoxy-L-arabinose transferase [Priestia megaterium]TPF22819.1 4-amino-4-deoxy-L-arabinose transferase [Priestia megaterium]
MKHMNSEVKEERTSNKKRIDLFLVPIVLIAAFLNLFKIWTDEYANAYYTAAVKSMLQSFHNFFYASFDPGGYVTIDKPPVVFWIQTISAKIFGFHGWSVILPQALAGIGSVLLLYVLVKRTFGVWAGRFAALGMALTPIVPAVSRTNNIDSMLVFTLLVATWMLFRAVRTVKFGWVLAAFAMIGVAFNMKMLQAYMVLPAFYVFYVVATKITWKKKIAFLTTATALMLAVSVSWAVVVDSTSADKRPYMGSSQTNSVLELAFGYNGINRLTGNTSVTGSSHKQPAQAQQQTASNETKQTSNSNAESSQSSNQSKSSSSKKMQAPGGGNQNGMFNTGNPGPFRLFQKGLSDQISWLLPFVIFSIVGLFAGMKFKGPYTTKQKESLFWLAWLLPVAVFFSIAGFFHQYYLIMLAPPIAAFAGAGAVALWSMYKQRNGWKSWLLPGGILTTAALQVYIMSPYVSSIGVAPIAGVGALGVILALVLAIRKERKNSVTNYLGVAAMVVLLAMPAYWAMTPIIYGGNSMLPAAGPDSSSGMGGPPSTATNSKQSGFNGMQPPGSSGSNSSSNNQMQPPSGSSNGGQMQMPGGSSNNGQMQPPSGSSSSGQMPGGSSKNNGQMQMPSSSSSKLSSSKRKSGGMNAEVNTKLLNYLTKNNTGEKYLFATTDSTSAAPYIIKTGKPVMAMGGFSGSDPILTVSKLKSMIKKGEVKYFYLSGMGKGGQSDVITWIKENSKEIPSSKWQFTSSSSQQGPSGNGTLYEITLK